MVRLEDLEDGGVRLYDYMLRPKKHKTSREDQ